VSRPVTTKERVRHTAEHRRKAAVDHVVDRIWFMGAVPRRWRERLPVLRFRLQLAREELVAWMAQSKRIVPVIGAVLALMLAAGALAIVVGGGSGNDVPKIEPVKALTPQSVVSAGAAARERRAHARHERALARKRAARRRVAAAGRRRAARHKKATPAAPQVAAAKPKVTAQASPSPAPRTTPRAPVSRPAPTPAPARPAPAPAPKPAPKGVHFDDES
jgi:hypothetical protein